MSLKVRKRGPKRPKSRKGGVGEGERGCTRMAIVAHTVLARFRVAAARGAPTCSFAFGKPLPMVRRMRGAIGKLRRLRLPLPSGRSPHEEAGIRRRGRARPDKGSRNGLFSLKLGRDIWYKTGWLRSSSPRGFGRAKAIRSSGVSEGGERPRQQGHIRVPVHRRLREGARLYSRPYA